MRILVFGAGPLGSLLAARLKQGGHHDVTLLARGNRLKFLESSGIALKNWTTGETEIVPINLCSQLKPGDQYDLVIVIMRKNAALKILPILAKNSSPLFLFLMNNAAGPEVLVDALGTERVLTGFFSAAGYREGETIVYINAEPAQPGVINIGLPGGGTSVKLEAIAQALGKGIWLDTAIQEDMDAWLKYHVALLFPSLAPTAYMCDFDRLRLANTRDALVLAVRAMKEGFRVLLKLGYPVTPASFKRFLFIPEPILVAIVKKLCRNPRMDIAMMRHARAIRDEILQLNGEFLELVKQSGMFTPNIQFLTKEFAQNAPLMPEGSGTIRMNWNGIFLPAGVLILLGLITALLL